MDYKTFISSLAHKTGCDNGTATRLVEGFCTIVREECANSYRVAIPGFGSFEGVKHDEEITTDLATGRRLLRPPSIEVRVTPGGMLKKTLKEGTQ